MAVGEYISVRSQRELLDYQVELQRQQLRHTPEQERAILVEMYESRGLSRADARFIVDRLLAKHPSEPYSLPRPRAAIQP